MSCYQIINRENRKKLESDLKTNGQFANIFSEWSKGYLYGCKFIQLDTSTIDTPYNDDEEISKKNLQLNQKFLEKLMTPFIKILKTEEFYLFSDFNDYIVEVEKRTFSIKEYIYTVLENGSLVEELKESKFFVTSLIPDDPSPRFCISSDCKMGFIGHARSRTITVFGDELIEKVLKIDFEGISNIKVFEPMKS